MSMIRYGKYSGTKVYQTSLNGSAVMRRVRDNYVNATQILRGTGLMKMERKKVIDKYIDSGGVHEKIQGGFAVPSM